jgi:hypothetical protein
MAKVDPPNFRAIARARVGGRWSGLDESERRAHTKAEKVRWLAERMGGEALRESYSQWLWRQSRAVQDRILGPDQALRFRDGRLKIQRFTDRGRALSLAELGSTVPEEYPTHDPEGDTDR